VDGLSRPASPPPERRWNAFHLYRGGRLEPLLLTGVAPLVAALEADGWIDGFFFVRYWEGGQHLRLRLGRRPRIAAADLESRVRSFLGTVAAAPQRVDAAPYEPEVVRYGGRLGLAAAERCFVASSRFVLARLGEVDAADEAALHGLAAAVLVASVAAWGLDHGPASAFLGTIEEEGFQQLRHGGMMGGGAPSEARLREAFAAAYARQRTHVEARMAQLWQALRGGEPGVLADWSRDLAAVHDDLLAIERAGRLAGRPHLRWPAGERLAAPCWRIAGILFDLVHMTNNRLGLDNHQEIYVAGLVARALAAAEAAR